MNNKMFLDVEEVANLTGKPRSSSYRLIRDLNTELKEKGYITITGLVSRKYFMERFYGMVDIV